ncbi:MAG: 3-phosphoshikimate 1-carboxyvinyltransferase [Clostridia bacterium]|nr:3-phosphoshikimate 1-carboxyvinyltransferase [Clostridia bacterium]
MTVEIKGGPLSGAIAAVPSKSDMHRLLICSAFADVPTRISACGELPDDVKATLRCLSALGVGTDLDANGVTVTPAESVPEKAELYVGESGSTLRFLVPVAASLGVRADFITEGRLGSRPMGPLIEELGSHGAQFEKTQDGILRVFGKLSGNGYAIRSDVSSQYISGILFALARSGGGSVRLLGKTSSAGYIEMTLDTLSRFGIRTDFKDGVISVSGELKSPGRVVAEGDWSGAAFWLCTGAARGGITVTGLPHPSRQGDRAIVDIIRRMGAKVEIKGDAATVSGGDLHGVELDASDVPDLVPPLAALAAVSKGLTVIRGASRLRIKESDRLAALASSLGALGADIKETEDGLVIHGREKLPGGSADSSGDHRIAMAVAVASVRSGGITLSGAESVSKSYPGFWKDFQELGGNVKTTEGLK